MQRPLENQFLLDELATLSRRLQELEERIQEISQYISSDSGNSEKVPQ